MSSYLQMGHDSENLVGGKDIGNYTGIVLSPVNRGPGELANKLLDIRKKGSYTTLFDPQLYFPKSKRGSLKEHSYFPKDLDTADYTSSYWWQSISDKIIDFCRKINIDFLISPVILPKIFESDYYNICNSINYYLSKKLKKENFGFFITVLVQHNQLTSINNVLEVASSLTSIDCSGYYILIENDINPRNEFKDSDALFGVMQLIRELKKTNKTILCSHCSSDMILYKYAGANHCATGKFFNLRRFTKSRFSNDIAGGGQQAYFFANGLLGFLREPDILRIKRSMLGEMLNIEGFKNVWGTKIINNLDSTNPKPWVAMGWRQYLCWFSYTEREIEKDKKIVFKIVNEAKNNWEILENTNIFMDERANNGVWLDGWLEAIKKFDEYNKE